MVLTPGARLSFVTLIVTMLAAFVAAAYAFYTGIQSGAVLWLIFGIFLANFAVAVLTFFQGISKI